MNQTRLNRWCQWDEFGLVIGLGQFTKDGKSLIRVRKPGETNKQLAARIKNVFRYPGSSSKQGVLNGVSRDLGTPIYNLEDKNLFLLKDQIDPTREENVVVYTNETGSYTQLSPRVVG